MVDARLEGPQQVVGEQTAFYGLFRATHELSVRPEDLGNGFSGADTVLGRPDLLRRP